MSPRARRILIPLLVAVLALGVVAIMIFSPARSRTAPAAVPGAPAAAATGQGEPAPVPADEAEGRTPAGQEPIADQTAQTPPEVPAEPAEPSPDVPEVNLSGLIATAPPAGVSGHDILPASLGSLDPADAPMRLEFSRAGAALKAITLSGIWETAAAHRQAEAYYAATRKGQPPKKPLPDEKLRYLLQKEQLLKNLRLPGGITVPILAANQITINGTAVNILDYTPDPQTNGRIYVWAETAPGVFQTVIVNDADEPILRITRRFVLGDGYDITLQQHLENLTGRPLAVQFSQFGPGDLRQDRSRYMDRRRFRFGYLDPQRDPQRQYVLSSDSSLLFERNKLAKEENTRVWPNAESVDNGYELSWFAATNRYFALAVHPVLDGQGKGNKALIDEVAEILHEESFLNPAKPEQPTLIFTYLNSPVSTIEAGGTLALDLGIYAGPLDREILEKKEPYVSLNMRHLILFQMSSMCAFCTFQWLAHLLLGFLSLLHDYILFDWALAIIALVIVVRTLLHPLTKKSQVSMQRFGKVMGEMKPEIEKLQKKYPNDPKKVQQEQMKLMRERGANPLQMLGCLPMFLQTPIWIALYAMLYFTFDLRQEPAFFGLFQKVTGGMWPFLADLSAADHCFGELATPTTFLMWNVTGINILPILMGLIFFVQQKYMSPPPSPTMTKEQLTQQKMMKVMMVVLFPLMLYSAPSGLTLYILTSSSIGILESRYVRRHIKEMDLNPAKKENKKKRKKVKSRDPQGRAYAASLERLEEKRRRKQKGPEKKYKKRK